MNGRQVRRGRLSVATYSEEGYRRADAVGIWGDVGEGKRPCARSRKLANLVNVHLSDSKESDARSRRWGFKSWPNDYLSGNPRVAGRVNPIDDGYKAAQLDVGIRRRNFWNAEDALIAIESYKASGGFRSLMCFAHDWSDREQSCGATSLLARYVDAAMPRPLKRSTDSANVCGEQEELMENRPARS